MDRLLQQWRISKARTYIPQNARVLDIGCTRGELFELLGDLNIQGVGIEPSLDEQVDKGNYQLIRGSFPQDYPDIEDQFDVICALALLEHIPPELYSEFAVRCFDHLKRNGWLIITVPSPIVDFILNILSSIKIIDGIELQQHHGFQPSIVPDIFCGVGLRLVKRETFQLGLNNLFVFRKE